MSMLNVFNFDVEEENTRPFNTIYTSFQPVGKNLIFGLNLWNG